MDLPLSARVTAPNSAPSPADGGGVVSFGASTAAELQRRAQQIFDQYGNPAVAPLATDTVATMVRGFTLGAVASGTAFMCSVQMEPDEATIATPGPTPLVQQIPLNAIQGTYPLGFAALQFVECSDPSELARPDAWATSFWAAQGVHKGLDAGSGYLYELQVCGPFNRVWVAGLLWGFYPAFE